MYFACNLPTIYQKEVVVAAIFGELWEAKPHVT